MQVRNLEKVGLTRQQAEMLTEHLTEVLCSHKEKLSQNFVSRAMLEKVRSLCSGLPHQKQQSQAGTGTLCRVIRELEKGLLPTFVSA